MTSEDGLSELGKSKTPFPLHPLKLDFIPEVKSNDDWLISSEEDFKNISEIADRYVNYDFDGLTPFEIFSKIGFQINQDFQFFDQVGGCNTLAGQLRHNTRENRDCKLPTFLLALIQHKIHPQEAVDIVFMKTNISHPYARLKVDDDILVGHYKSPSRTSAVQISHFEMLDEGLKRSLERFDRTGHTHSFPPTLEGMQGMDELFKSV